MNKYSFILIFKKYFYLIFIKQKINKLIQKKLIKKKLFKYK